MKHLILFVLSALILTGCSQTKKTDDLVIQIRTTKATNRGRSLYMVVKDTSRANFLMEDYDSIYAQAFQNKDEKVLLTKPLIPGMTEKLTLPITEKEKSIGIYFMFTNPGESWKCFVDHPEAKKVKVLLGRDEYDAINVY